MERERNTLNNKYQGRILLLIIMICFCILALIEILYGQARLRLERERIALEEENRRMMQELAKEEENGLAEETLTADVSENDVAAIPEETPEASSQPEESVAEADGQPEETPGQTGEEEKHYDMQIVFLGDSILDGDRGESGVAAIVGHSCGAKVYNLAIGGTTAALRPGERYDFNNWSSWCGLGVVNAMLGNIDHNVFTSLRAKDDMDACDFSQTDYFVIEYGINDFLSQIPQSRYMADGSTLNVSGTHTYTGALETMVQLLSSAYPSAKILLVSPHYCQFYDGATFVGDAYSLGYGYGNLLVYSEGTTHVYEVFRDNGNVFYFNAFADSGIDAYSAEDYLEDGIHLTPLGQRKYAEAIAKRINDDFRIVE